MPILFFFISFFVRNDYRYNACIQLETQTQSCEVIYSWPFKIGQSLTAVNFEGTSFPLYGFNHLRFNMLGEGSDIRPYLPFKIVINPPKSYGYRVESFPKAVVSDDGNTITYQSNNDPYKNKLKVIWKIKFFREFETTDSRWLNPELLILQYFIIIASACFVIYQIYQRQRLTNYVVLTLFSFLIIKGNFLPFEIAFFTYLYFFRNKLNLLLISLIIIAFSYFASSNLGCYTCQNILHPGSDPLSYESLSREIYLNGKFLSTGEEGAFHISPLYRYFLATFHLLGGESLWSVRFFGFIIMFFFYILTFKLIMKIFNGKVALASLLLFTLLDKLPQLGLLFLFKEYYSESIAFPVLILSVYLLLFANKKRFVSAGVMFGLAIATRNNYLPAILPLVWYLYSKRMFSPLFVFLVFASLGPVFVIYRNYMITGEPLFFVTSTAASLQLDLYARFYHGQRESSPLMVLVRVISLFFSDPMAVIIPLWKNLLTMTGMIGLIDKSQIYLPVWLVGIPGILYKLKHKITHEELAYIFIFLLLFIFHLPFGLHNSGSAKYYPFMYFLTPYAFHFLLSLYRRKAD